MNKIPTTRQLHRALWFLFLCLFSAGALALPSRGTQLNNWCAMAPIQAVAPQQSRPYQAAGSACTVCHTSGNPSTNDLNARGTAAATCTGTGTTTVCGTAVNQYCVATPPTNASITAPPVGTTVAHGTSVTFTGAIGTNPDGFPLAYTWLFSSGQPNATGQSVAVPMTVTGSVTSTLQVRNSVGMLATGTTPTRVVTVTGTANQAPTATIGAPAGNVTIAQGGTVSFAGSGTDPDNNLPLTYSWTFPGGTPASSTAQNPGTVTYNTAGTFTATFMVTDSLGLASPAVTRTITVTGANQPPTATISAPAGNVTIAQGGTVSFAGSGTDPDNNLPLTYSWTFPGGSPASSTAQNPGNVTYATAGTYTASFLVRDSLGLASATVTRTITVTGANQAPTATIGAPAGNVSIIPGGTVAFAGSGTDPDNNLPLTYSWSFPGGSPASSTAQNPGSVTYATAGTYTASFLVRDSLGLASATVTRTITVAAGTAPVATITNPSGNVTIRQGRTVEFEGSASGSTNGPFTYRWAFPGGTPATSTSIEPGDVRFNTAGVFTVTFTVTNARGVSSAPATRTITVTGTNQAPTATITAPAANVTIARGGTVSFAGSGTDPDNNLPLTYSWTFPGGSPASSTAQNPGAVTYATVGTYTASFLVRDSRGLASATVTRTITVTEPPNQAPTATITTPAAAVNIFQGQTVSFAGTGTDPDNNLPLTYSWSFPGGTPASSTAQNPGTVTYNTVGTFTASFTVTDSKGLASQAVTRSITVAPSVPMAIIVTPAINVSILPGGSVNFTGAGEGTANLPLTYSWTFPGGTPASSTSQNPGAVRFSTAGTYTVTLTIKDSAGRSSDPTKRVITVAPRNQGPGEEIGECINDD